MKEAEQGGIKGVLGKVSDEYLGKDSIRDLLLIIDEGGADDGDQVGAELREDGGAALEAVAATRHLRRRENLN